MTYRIGQRYSTSLVLGLIVAGGAIACRWDTGARASTAEDSKFSFAVHSAPHPVAPSFSPTDHLRIAADKLREDGFEEQANRLRKEADQLERAVAAEVRRLKEATSPQPRLEQISVERRSISLHCEMLEVDRQRVAGEEGIALLRKLFGKEWKPADPLGTQLHIAASSPEFVDAADKANLLSRRQQRSATVLIGGEALIESDPNPDSEAPRASPPDSPGVTLRLTPRQLRGARVTLDLEGEVCTRVAKPTGQPDADPRAQEIRSHRVNTQVEMRLGETLIVGGILGDQTLAAFGYVDPTSYVPPKVIPGNYETLLLITPTELTSRDVSMSAGLDRQPTRP